MDPNTREHLDALEIDIEELSKLDGQEQLKTFKAQYRKLIQKWHPDKHAHSQGYSKEYMEAKFKMIHHAYKMLTDMNYREKEKSRQRGGQQTNLHAVININLPFEQAYLGSTTHVTFNASHLDADGKPKEVDATKDVHMDVSVVEVKIPARTLHGDKIRIPKKGLKQGDRQGDLIFVVSVNPHPKFRVNPENPYEIQTDELVDLDLMLQGGIFEVLTFYGIKPFRIPAGTRPGDEVRIVGLGDDKKGCHTIKVQPKYPEKEELKKKSLWQKLGINWSKEQSLDDQQESEEEEYEKLFEKLGGFEGQTPGAFGIYFR